MDPLSITTGVLSLLGVCVSVSIELRRLKSGAGEAKSRISGLLSDVDNLRSVLQSMEVTLDDLQNKDRFQTTGHIGAHWHSLKQSLSDGKDTLDDLAILLASLDKNVSVLDGTRRYLRLEQASTQIVEYRQHVQSYRDTIQFSLQTITFWNTAVIHEDTAGLGAKVDALDKNLHELSANLEVKLQAWMTTVVKAGDERNRVAVGRLQDTVRSAAIVLSDASTAAAPVDNSDDLDDGIPILSRGNTWTPDDHFDNWMATVVDTTFPAQNGTNATPPATDSLDGSLNPSVGAPTFTGASPPSNSGDATFESSRSLSQSASNTTPQVVPSPLPGVRSGGNVPSPSRSSFWSRHLSRHKASSSTTGIKVADPKPSHTSGDYASGGIAPADQQHLLARAKKSLNPRKLPTPVLAGKGGKTFTKAVCVGDGATGKTCFLVTFTNKLFPEVYIPTVFENYVAEATVDGMRFDLALWDTAGQEDYDKLRPLSYPDAHVIIICYQVAWPASFQSVTKKWIAEVAHFAPDVPRMLVGLQSDQRHDARTLGQLLKGGSRPITTQEGVDLAEELGCFAYAECSALTGEGVDQTFEVGLRGLMELWQEKGVLPQAAKKPRRSWLFGKR